MPIDVQCEQCGKREQVIPARARKYRFCSYKCRGEWRSKHFSGEANPNWRGGGIEKKCAYCGKPFSHKVSENKKFCSKPCADKGGFRYTGESHPNYRKDARRRNRGGSHHKWVIAVISRDNATCQHCGASGIELHAHHVKPYRDNPELRFDVSNGITLCYKCHWKVHSATTANGVNSGKAEAKAGNPEPSLSGNIREGATTNNRAYRRWEGECAYCGTFVSKRLSDVKNNANVFCSKRCCGLYNQNWKHRIHGSNVDTSAPHESDDIV